MDGRIAGVEQVIPDRLQVPGKGNVVTAVVESSVAARSRTVADVLESGVGAGVVMSVVSSDGPAAGWLVVGEPVGGAERQCAVVGVAQGAVLAAGAVSRVTVVGDPIPMADPMPAWALGVAGAIWETQRVQRELESARAAVLANEARLERIVDAAHEYAEENSLCERYDQFMVSVDSRFECRFPVPNVAPMSHMTAK